MTARSDAPRPAFAFVALLALLFALPARSGELVLREAKISVQIDVKARTLFGKALLTFHNQTGRDLAALDLKIPAPAGAGAKIKVVWDKHEDLPWRRLRRQEAPGEFLIQFPLTNSLREGKKRIVGVSFEINAEGLDAFAPVRITDGEVNLNGTGWFPAPAEGPGRPRRTVLTILLPKDWVVVHPAKLKKRKSGILLAEYELKRGAGAEDDLLFAARAPAVE